MKKTISRIVALCIFLGSLHASYASREPQNSDTKKQDPPSIISNSAATEPQPQSEPAAQRLSVPRKRRKTNSGDEFIFPPKRPTS